jgi:hypothetical protein
VLVVVGVGDTGVDVKDGVLLILGVIVTLLLTVTVGVDVTDGVTVGVIEGVSDINSVELGV